MEQRLFTKWGKKKKREDETGGKEFKDNMTINWSVSLSFYGNRNSPSFFAPTNTTNNFSVPALIKVYLIKTG